MSNGSAVALIRPLVFGTVTVHPVRAVIVLWSTPSGLVQFTHMSIFTELLIRLIPHSRTLVSKVLGPLVPAASSVNSDWPGGWALEQSLLLYIVAREKLTTKVLV